MLLLGIVGPIIYWAVIIVLGATTPGYDPARMEISALGHGPRGWIQNANFIFFGLSIAALGLALRADFRFTRHGNAFLNVFYFFAFCFVLLGLFPDNLPGRHTVHGYVHSAAVLSLALCFPVAVGVLGTDLEQDLGWRPFSGFARVVAVFSVVAMVSWLWHFEVGGQRGLYERFYMAIAALWLEALAAAHIRQRILHGPRGHRLTRT
jgi:hypothetical membrane protein